ncbi:MAG: coproporphyrinogen III oxidase family protein, partial [Acidobacteria bacterium]|nr:coproporphyrinogen III oxidase family protein [Acidobacteriota bacterium]
TDDEVDHYLSLLEREMILQKARLGVDLIPARSVLIGGGTPSFLSPPQLERFLQSIHRHYNLSQCAQFSFEPEPSTMLGEEGGARIRLLKEYGVTRTSMGVQSFDDQVLRFVGRNHSATQALEAIARLREGGIESISIDLIYGLPDQSMEAWIHTMQTALESGADAWQLYRLRILPHGDKPGKIVQQFQKAPSRFPGVDDTLLMKVIGIMMSEEGGFHEHYTRIFARSPQHISYYLHDVNVGLSDVVGVGVSAWSNFGDTFALNIGDNLPAYFERLQRDRLPVDRGMRRDADDERRRSFILPLKNVAVDKAAYLARTGETVEPFREEVEKMKALGLIEEDEHQVRLTTRGRFFADEVCMQFFSPRHIPKRQLTQIAASG